MVFFLVLGLAAAAPQAAWGQSVQVELQQRQVETKEKVEEAVAVERRRAQPSRKPPLRLGLSGRINQAFLFADDDHSGTRVGFRGESDGGETTIGSRLED